MSHLQQLYHLQEIDNEIQAKKKRLGEIIRAQKGNEPLQQAREQAAITQTALSKWQTARKELDLEMQAIVSKSKQSEQRLYSGEIKNTKELADLQSEIEALERRRATFEDEILETMVKIEETETANEVASTALAELESRWAKEQNQLQQEQKELALRLHHLNEAREKTAVMIPTELFNHYTKVSQQKGKGGVAVARLKINMCEGCQVNVSAQIIKEAKEGRIVHCRSCDRILVHF